MGSLGSRRPAWSRSRPPKPLARSARAVGAHADAIVDEGDESVVVPLDRAGTASAGAAVPLARGAASPRWRRRRSRWPSSSRPGRRHRRPRTTRRRAAPRCGSPPAVPALRQALASAARRGSARSDRVVWGSTARPQVDHVAALVAGDGGGSAVARRLRGARAYPLDAVIRPPRDRALDVAADDGEADRQASARPRSECASRASV